MATQEDIKYNIDDFDIDLPLFESALDDFDGEDVYDNDFQELNTNYSKCEFILVIRFQYNPLGRIYKNNNITEKAKKIIKRVMNRIYMLLVDSLFISEPEDLTKVYISNSNKKEIDISNTEEIFNILKDESVCFLNVEGRTTIYTEIYKDYVRAGLGKLYHNIAAFIHKTGVKELKYNRTRLTFRNVKGIMKDYLTAGPKDVISAIPKEKFDNLEWSFGTIFKGINIETGESFEFKDDIYAELEESGNNVPVNTDFLFKKSESKTNVAMLLCQQTNGCIQLYSVKNPRQITINSGWKQNYNPYTNDARSVNLTIKYLSETLMPFIEEHQDEIIYKTYMQIINSDERNNALIASCLTNVRVIIGDMAFFVSVNLRHNLDQVVNGKLTNAQKDMITNFINDLNARYSNRTEIVKVINEAFNTKFK